MTHPVHYASAEAAIGEVDLQPYLGLYRVIHCLGSSSLILSAHIEHALNHLPPRILLRTASVASQSWASFTTIAPAKLSLLATKNIAFIDIDRPSIDPATSKEFPCHHLLQHHSPRVLENLLLDDVPEGDCELIALLLKLTQADASPVRAVLGEPP